MGRHSLEAGTGQPPQIIPLDPAVLWALQSCATCCGRWLCQRTSSDKAPEADTSV